MKPPVLPTSTLDDRLRDRVREAPTGCGVYWMTDARGHVIYVGKAVNVRARLRSHLKPTGRSRQRIHRNWRRVKQIQWMSVSTEDEALSLEENLIRQHRPAFNIVRPHYGFLCLTTSEPFPRFGVVREMTPRDGNLYFGPYPDRRALNRVFRALLPLFRIRGDEQNCAWNGQDITHPCHHFEFGWCSAPCAGRISARDYRSDADSLANLLQGGRDELGRELLKATDCRIEASREAERGMEAQQQLLCSTMEEAARNLQFEDAARLRDQVAALDRQILGETARLQRLARQRRGLRRSAEAAQVVQSTLDDLDVWAIASDGTRFAITVLPFRDGRASAGITAAGTEEDIHRALKRHYRCEDRLPSLILFTGSGGRVGSRRAAAAAPVETSESALRPFVEKVREALRPEWVPQALPELCEASKKPEWGAARDLARLNGAAPFVAPPPGSRSSAGA